MPSKGRIHSVKDPVPSHEGLGVALFLTGAAKYHYRALLAGLCEVSLKSKGCCKCPRTEEVMSAAMSIRIVSADGLPLGLSACLGKLRQGIVLCKKGYDRMSLSEACLKGSGHAVYAGLDRKALLPEHILKKLCAFELMKSRLRIIKDAVRQLDDLILLAVYRIQYKSLLIHAALLFYDILKLSDLFRSVFSENVPSRYLP